MRISNLLLFLVLVVFSSSSFSQSIVAGSVTLTSGKDAHDNEINVLIIDGALAHPMASKIKELLQSLKNQNLMLVLLNSSGGSVNEGQKIIGLFKAEKSKGRKLVTSVENGKTCASMCVPLFAQGDSRYAGEVSSFMFHGATMHEMTNIPNEIKTREQLKFLTDAGVSQTWLDKLWILGVFSKPGAYWLTGKELFEAQSNLVTRLINRHQLEKPWFAPMDPNLGPR